MRVEIKVKGGIWFGQIRFEEIGSGAPPKEAKRIPVREGEVFKVDYTVEEGTVGEEIVVLFTFQSGKESSEAEEIKEKKFLAEKKREKRGFGDSFLLTGLEVFGAFEPAGDPIGEREFDCVKIGDLMTFADEVFFQKFELGGLAAPIHAGKGDVSHRLRVSKSVILGNERRFFGHETGYREAKMNFCI